MSGAQPNKATVKKKSNKRGKPNNSIANNPKARHDFEIFEQTEAGLALEGWEVKSIRAGKVQLKESYVIIKQGEAWLFNAHISPLLTASTHIKADPRRSRKLLLKRKELNKLIGAVERKGMSILCLSVYWQRQLVKAKIALGRGKKKHDKRQDDKNRDWQRGRERHLKRG